ncbi:MAG TPA: hypothetical protein VJN18_32580 [Polyangiaceae bacterium]|nr:hypothetical protein [Polyangiaceae bacterium]
MHGRREKLLDLMRRCLAPDATVTLNAADCAALLEPQPPIPMRITCPECGQLHVDEGEWATRTHHSHSCQHCGLTWRPAVVPTVGVRFLPGFKNAKPPTPVNVDDPEEP